MVYAQVVYGDDSSFDFETSDTPSDLQNVMRITFSAATSAAPILTAYDNSNHDTTAVSEMLVGTTGTSTTSFLKAKETTGGSSGAAWCTVSTSNAGGNTVNELDADNRYCQCAAIAGAATSKIFNVVCWIPSDVRGGSWGHQPVLSCKYAYTGSAPTITWALNTGTEAVPTWTTLTSTGIIHFTGPNTTTSKLDPVQAPSSGAELAGELWFSA